MQGVKKGIVELAHIFVVTKADGDLLSAAKSTAADYRGAIRVLQQSSSNTKSMWSPSVLLTSSVTKDGLGELWQSIQEYKDFLLVDDRWETLRQQQAKYWMWKQFTRLMQERMKNDAELAKEAATLNENLLHGDLTPRVAAQQLLDSVFSQMEKE